MTATFNPTFGGHYYRTIYCIIKHHAPLSFEAMGTGHTHLSDSTPAFYPYPITEQHIAAHKRRAAVGLGHHGPDALRDMVARRAIRVDAVRGWEDSGRGG